jgi:hypothetical protein
MLFEHSGSGRIELSKLVWNFANKKNPKESKVYVVWATNTTPPLSLSLSLSFKERIQKFYKSPLWIRHCINWHISKRVCNECSPFCISVLKRTSLFQTQLMTRGHLTSQISMCDVSVGRPGHVHPRFSNFLKNYILIIKKPTQVFFNRPKNLQKTQCFSSWL